VSASTHSPRKRSGHGYNILGTSDLELERLGFLRLLKPAFHQAKDL